MLIKSIAINPPNKGVYIEVDIQEDSFFLDIGNLYMEFSRINQDTFQLVGSHSEDFQGLHPVVSWSGVLWTRQEALRVHESLTSYHQDLNPID